MGKIDKENDKPPAFGNSPVFDRTIQSILKKVDRDKNQKKKKVKSGRCKLPSF